MIRLRKMICAERGLEDSQQAFADWLGVSLSRWNNVERGYPVSRSLGDMLVEKIPGMSKDWIDHARTDALSVGLARRLAGAEDTQEPHQRAS